jgi:hypothetical protein
MTATYLVFGDLHGRILPAFRLASVWAREYGTRLDGILQVGDLGYFPNPATLDKATKRHAEKDPLELGAMLVAELSKEADAIFAEEQAPKTLWFTAGNHEDYEELARWESGAGGRADSFAVDAYCRVRCIRDGHVETLPGQLRTGALWGIDDRAPLARTKTPTRARIRARSATELAAASFDVLLCHESPRDAIREGSGSEEITAIISLAQPAFVFFGHYHTAIRRVEAEFGETKVYHLPGLEFRGSGGTAEEGCVGVLRWTENRGEFAYVEEEWLRSISRHNWKWR